MVEQLGEQLGEHTADIKDTVVEQATSVKVDANVKHTTLLARLDEDRAQREEIAARQEEANKKRVLAQEEANKKRDLEAAKQHAEHEEARKKRDLEAARQRAEQEESMKKITQQNAEMMREYKEMASTLKKDQSRREVMSTDELNGLKRQEGLFGGNGAVTLDGSSMEDVSLMGDSSRPAASSSTSYTPVKTSVMNRTSNGPAGPFYRSTPQTLTTPSHRQSRLPHPSTTTYTSRRSTLDEAAPGKDCTALRPSNENLRPSAINAGNKHIDAMSKGHAIKIQAIANSNRMTKKTSPTSTPVVRRYALRNRK